MLIDFFFKLQLMLQGARIDLSATIVGYSQMSIGVGCTIKPYVYLKAATSSCLIIENNVHIERYSHLSSKGRILKVGRYSYIGYNNWIGGQGDIIIGENFMSGMNVVIVSSNHDYEKITVPYISGPEVPGTVKIGRNVWVGANVVVLPNVEIGEGSVVAAGSVVSSDVPRDVVVAGQPAKVVKEIRRQTQ